jgi:hypothetical protein
MTRMTTSRNHIFSWQNNSLATGRRVHLREGQSEQTLAADALIVLLRHLPDRANLAPEEREAIETFEKMANDIANIKEKHKLQAVELCIS